MSLSRRYRPQTFGDITGQESVKETLRREIATGKIGHAYLFFGPRGVGKTTTARIFAKALNCESPKDGEPCNACSQCANANEGRAIDLIEIDAASHNGVEHVREAIVEHVRFAPSSGKHKIYVLDEAHMLTTAAWNAMLKTLEEPPSHGIFILATTEFHKVPVTIVSRCQRFEFTRLDRDSIQERIRTLSKSEGATLDDDVVKRIAKHADGAVRDAETILGQLIALGEKEITDDVAGLLLPVSRLPAAAEFLKTTSTRSLKDTMQFVGKLAEQGIQIIPFFHDVIEAVRHLLIASDDETYAKDLAEGDEGERAVAELVGIFAPAELRDIALVCMERRKDAKQGVDPRFALELAGASVALAILPNSPKNSSVISTPSTFETSPSPLLPRRGVLQKNSSPNSVILSEERSDESKDPSSKSISLSDFQSAWPPFLKLVNEVYPSLSFILKTSRAADVKDNIAIIEVSYSFHRTKLIDNIATKQKLEDLLCEALNATNVTLDAIVASNDVIPDSTSEAEQNSAKAREIRNPRREETDTVSSLLQNFGGQVVE